jgi:excisionase family DNA binding protein
VKKMARKARLKNWLIVGKIGEFCSVSTATVRRWIKTGEMSAIRLPSGHFRVSLTNFKDFLKRYDMPVSEELYEMSELEERLREAIRQSPEGATLAQLAERLNIALVVDGRAAGSLLDVGEVRKGNNHYYPANSGIEQGNSCMQLGLRGRGK